MHRLALLAVSLALAGCGATTVRLAVAPTLDTGGRPGVTGTLSLGVGMPLDFQGRSHHFLQALGTAGGGRDGATGAGMFVAAQNLDYIYWAEPRMDVRAGAAFVYQNLPNSAGAVSRFGGGVHVGLLPMVLQDNASWLVTHLCVGPELRVEALSGAPSGGAMGLFSAPLVVELNLLGAGD